ncbi:MAG: tyrosine-type recombinase/integrase [bacterium]|nr:tyrosine-type recombinase/integrase [bacterium]
MKQSDKPIVNHITDFLEYLEIERGAASKTQENYARYLNKFVKWLKMTKNDGLRPHELTPDHIWQYRIFMARSPISETSKKTLCKKTQNFYLIAIRSLLTFFTDRDIQSMPADKIKLAKRDKDEQTIRFLNLDQVEKLLLTPNTSHNIGLRDRAILEVLFSTGLRIAELVALNRDQIKIKTDTKDIELSITGKGNHTRTVYFSDRTVRWLRKYLNVRRDDDKALFINYKKRKESDQSPIRLTVRSIERMVEKYAQMAGLPIIVTPHVLRHTLATDLLNQGADLRVVQEILGHQSVATTQIYTHVTNKRLREMHRQFHSGKKLKE